MFKQPESYITPEEASPELDNRSEIVLTALHYVIDVSLSNTPQDVFEQAATGDPAAIRALESRPGYTVPEQQPAYQPQPSEAQAALASVGIQTAEFMPPEPVVELASQANPVAAQTQATENDAAAEARATVHAAFAEQELTNA